MDDVEDVSDFDPPVFNTDSMSAEDRLIEMAGNIVAQSLDTLVLQNVCRNIPLRLDPEAALVETQIHINPVELGIFMRQEALEEYCRRDALIMYE